MLLCGLSACSALPQQNQAISFSNPPSAGQLLPTEQRFFACGNIKGAQYMASTGFLIAGCEQIKPTQNQPFRVKSVQLVELVEGSTWQVEIESMSGTLWMPLPWHDWA